ncbi:MAG TPA: DUF4350 domain-containing protein [Blastocatellia bacterium]|nr:DUF4350 domain-containing protein [Blastocatellia bacterium]
MRPNARAILVVGVLFLVLVGLNFIFSAEPPGEEETEFNADRSSHRAAPFGALAFYTLLQERGHKVSRLDQPYTALKDRKEIGTLVVISPPPLRNPSDEEFNSLSEWVKAGGLLVIIDREITVEVAGVEIKTSYAYAAGESGAHALQPTAYTRGVERVALSRLASRVKVDSNSAVYHVGDVEGAVLADVKAGKGRIVLLTDPYIVANNGIAESDNAMLALNLFADAPRGGIAFDEFHHGYVAGDSGGLMAYFGGTPVPWMMWQGVLIVAAIVYTFGRRFGRPLPLRRERRTTNLEFVSSMANITRLARATDLAIQNIYWEFRNRLCRYSGLPSKADTGKLATAAARRAGMDERELRRLLARCEEAARGRQISDGELLNLVSRMREIESDLGL